jgi:hypothetical protein
LAAPRCPSPAFAEREPSLAPAGGNVLVGFAALDGAHAWPIKAKHASKT